ncbi:MAG TPA: UPF0280 family protein [Dehalococcoidales bacterium]|nr:UPF0280 family protein [Dehalococcoidales bacterium]
MYQPRYYRNWIKKQDLVHFNVIVEETDCLFSADTNLENKARQSIEKYRAILKKYIRSNPLFLTTLEPFSVDQQAPQIVQDMAECGSRAGVGPMAAVAGAIAQFCARDLAKYTSNLIIENGGDIYLKSQTDRLLGIGAGNSPLSGKIGIEIAAKNTPLGISTSSGTVGHSLSFGKADAVVILADSATLSDAVATAIGNVIITAEDFSLGIHKAQNIKGVRGVLLIKDDRMMVWGEITIRRTEMSV